MEAYKKYYRIGFIGLILNVIVQLILFFIDPFLAAVASPFYPVWIIILVVGWRKKHPRR